MKIVRRLPRRNIGFVISLAFPSMPDLRTHAHGRIAAVHVVIVLNVIVHITVQSSQPRSDLAAPARPPHVYASAPANRQPAL